MESGIWIDVYTCQKREKMLFTYGEKTTVRALYQQQKICDSPHCQTFTLQTEWADLHVYGVLLVFHDEAYVMPL